MVNSLQLFVVEILRGIQNDGSVIRPTTTVMANTSWICYIGDCTGTDAFKDRCTRRKGAYTVRTI